MPDNQFTGLVSPACAGMIHDIPVGDLAAYSEPRMRGDDPKQLDEYTDSMQ